MDTRRMVGGCRVVMALVATLGTIVPGSLWATVTGAPGEEDARTPRLVAQTGHSGGIITVAFAPDGRTILTGSRDGTARLWDAASGREIRRLECHGRQFWSVAFAPDGRTVLTGSGDQTARLWDAATGREIRRLVGHGQGVRSVAFAPDGRTILTGSFDKTARLWDASSGREIRRLEGHGEGVWSVALHRRPYHPDRIL